jgi:hypothetical protein
MTWHENEPQNRPLADNARASTLRIAATLIGAIFIVSLVLYGLNDESEEGGGQKAPTAVAVTPQPAPGEQQAQSQQSGGQQPTSPSSTATQPSGPSNPSTTTGQGPNSQGNQNPQSGHNGNAGGSMNPAPAAGSQNARPPSSNGQ